MAYKLYTDGGARGNPGPSGIGIVLLNESGKEVIELSKYIGEATNNEAEYTALLEGLRVAAEKNVGVLECYLDSELVVRQLNGAYKVKNLRLKQLFDEVSRLTTSFDEITFNHVKRGKNVRADELVNLALDNNGS
jgi:ribonuclease HI